MLPEKIGSSHLPTRRFGWSAHLDGGNSPDRPGDVAAVGLKMRSFAASEFDAITHRGHHLAVRIEHLHPGRVEPVSVLPHQVVFC